jgi:hypothetical protein
MVLLCALMCVAVVDTLARIGAFIYAAFSWCCEISCMHADDTFAAAISANVAKAGATHAFAFLTQAYFIGNVVGDDVIGGANDVANAFVACA